jgi:IS605 OrfB family transposase
MDTPIQAPEKTAVQGPARSAGGLRIIAAPFVVAPPAGVRIRTRLRPTDAEARALTIIGRHLGHLYRADLAGRVALGRVPAAQRGRTERKRNLTALSSSRWAGAITRAAEDQYQLGLRVLAAEVSHLRTSIEALKKRIVVPVGRKDGKYRGYRNQSERFQKSRRLAQLKERLETAGAALAAGRPSIAVGGKRLWKSRSHLGDADLTRVQWEERWSASRMFLTADGESGCIGGNLTIRLTDDGTLAVKVPTPLVPALGDRLVLSVPVAFAHRGNEWVDRADARRCIRYDISFDALNGRWYLDASWSYGDAPAPPLEAWQSSGVVGVDLNADHLAACRLDASGNPVGTPVSFPLELAGLPAGSRDGRLRAAITALLDFARDTGANAIAIEDLDFQDARSTGRETMGRGARGRRFRRTVHGIPTGKFRDRLVAMATNRGLSVVAVDPAYTSKWGGQHWQKPLQAASGGAVTRHHAASVAIGRRALECRIGRREEGPRTRQRTGAGQPSPRPHQISKVAAIGTGPVRPAATSRPGPPGTDQQQAPKTVRGAST